MFTYIYNFPKFERMEIAPKNPELWLLLRNQKPLPHKDYN